MRGEIPASKRHIQDFRLVISDITMHRHIQQYGKQSWAKSVLPLNIVILGTLLFSSCITPPSIRLDTAHGVMKFINEESSCSGIAADEKQIFDIEQQDIALYVRRAEGIWIREYLRLRATLVYPADAPAVLMPARVKFRGISTIPRHGKTIEIRKELPAAAILILTYAENDIVEKHRVIAEYNIDWIECRWVLGQYSLSNEKKAERMEGSDAVDLCIGIEPGDTVDISVIYKCGDRRRMDRLIHDGGVHSKFLRRKIKDKSSCNITNGYLEIPFFDADGQPFLQSELTFQLDPEQRKPKYWSNYLWRVDMRLPDGKI